VNSPDQESQDDHADGPRTDGKGKGLNRENGDTIDILDTLDTLDTLHCEKSPAAENDEDSDE